MRSPLLMIAAVDMALSILLGAIGAHALTGQITEKALGWWHTASDYQTYQALGLLALSHQTKLGIAPAITLLLGSLAFSGSLYVLALGGPTFLVWITPMGGLAMLAGWLWIAKNEWRTA
ncbi:MAG: DUF423 domain-containing protein [Pseudomonadales bacterium]|nr:DUF423 domain-containing protein [Pseudomonadales bacterium]